MDPAGIRPATPADYDRIIAVWKSAGLSIKPTGRDTREAFLNQLRQFPSTYLVAEQEGQLVGVVLGTHDSRKGWINRLAVRPDFQRSGVASRLLTACELALHAQGIEIIAALVETENEASAALFQRCGYQDDVPVRYFRKLRRPDV